MAIAAVQADARMRGKQLKTHDDVVAYLPEWLSQDGLEPDADMVGDINSDSSIDLISGDQMNPECVSKCYKRKKEKQHDEVGSLAVPSNSQGRMEHEASHQSSCLHECGQKAGT